MRLQRPVRASASGRAGVPDGSPYVRAARQIGISAPPAVAGSAVGVARTAAVADRARALLPGRAVRAEHLDQGHRAVAELLVEAAYDGRREQLAAGSPRRSSRCGPRAGRRRSVSGVQWAATSSPTSSAQRPKTPCTRRSRSQPWSATSRPTVVSSSCGSRSSGWAPETRPRRGPLRARPAASGRASSGATRDDARVSARARSRPSSRCSRLGLAGVAGSVVVGRRRSSRRPPRRRRRTGPRPARPARRRRPPR